MNAETSLVIAVCVLGTLVGVAVVALAALLVVFCCPNGRLQPRSWVAQRNRRTRAEMELEQLAAATGNFISDSMLPGNRTGASENLGIRSPDPRRVPALRVPDDLSPSPPFVPGQGQPFRRTQPRSRQPSPKRGHFLTVLNTIMPHGSPPPPDHIDSQDQNDLSDTIFSSKAYRKRASDKGEYERIPSTSPKTRLNCSVRPKTQKARGNVQVIDGYPISEQSSEEGEDVEKCKDFGHSYYKPGGYTSYYPQNVFREKPSRKNRSPRRESRSLYSRIPINDNSLESPNRSIKHSGPKSRRRAPHLNGSSKTIGNKGSQGREVSRYLNRSHDEQLASTDTRSHQACARGQDRRDRSPPLASSSRNTSQDRSTSISVRHDNSHEERRPKGVESSNKMTGRNGVLPRRSRRVSSRHEDVNIGRGITKSTASNEHAAVVAVQKPSRVSGQRTRRSLSPRGSRDRLPTGNRTGATTTAPTGTDYLQATNGQLVPVSSLMRSGPSIQFAARDTPVCDGVSFRANSIASTDARPTYVHANRDAPVMGTASGHSSSAMMSLPSLTAAQIINNNNNMEPSVLYHNSHHSSTQSLRPQSHLLGGSSTFAGSHSIHLNMLQTPAAHSSHVVSLSDVEHQSPKAVTRFRHEGYPTQPWSARAAQGTDRSTKKNETQEATFSDTEEEDRQDDRQAPDSVPPSPPASNTSSSSPGPAISLAIQQCVPVTKEVVTMTAPLTERPSFLDSRDLGDPTTASMSWDHLTPDPSPLFSGETDLSSSQYTQFYRRKKRLISETGQADITLPGASTLADLDFDDTFARNYELKSYKKFEIRGDTRVTANLNPAIEQEVAASDAIGETCAQGLNAIHSEASVNCTSLLTTQGRQNVAVRPINIINRFALKEIASRDSASSVKSDESFSTPLITSKKVFGAIGSCPTVPVDNAELPNKNMYHRGSEDSTPGDPVMYSKLIQNLSLQLKVKP